MKYKFFLMSLVLFSLAACGFAFSGGVITPEELAKSAAECGHGDAKVALIQTFTGSAEKTLTTIEISSETMQLARKDRCLQNKLLDLGSNFELKLVAKNAPKQMLK